MPGVVASRSEAGELAIEVVDAGERPTGESRTRTVAEGATESDDVKRRDVGAGLVDDLISLPVLHEPAILEALMRRYEAEMAARFMAQGGQRVGTLLVYLNDVASGGETVFPTLGLGVKPKRGRCLLFFPGFEDGRRDERLLHAALPAVEEKWVAQVWVRAEPDPLRALRPPRWPRGCSDYGDVLDIVRSMRARDSVPIS